MIEPIYNYGLPYILTESGLVYTGPVVVGSVIVSNTDGGTLKLWDNTAASGTVLVDTFTFPAGSGVYPLNVKATTALYATVGGTLAATLVYNPYVGG